MNYARSCAGHNYAGSAMLDRGERFESEIENYIYDDIQFKAGRPTTTIRLTMTISGVSILQMPIWSACPRTTVKNWWLQPCIGPISSRA